MESTPLLSQTKRESVSFNITNNLGYHDNVQMMIKVIYADISDDVLEGKIAETQYHTLKRGSNLVIMNCTGYIGIINIYLSYGNDNYRYDFDIKSDKQPIEVTMKDGVNDPVIKINNLSATKRTYMYTYSLYRLGFGCCFCCSIPALLDDIASPDHSF